MTPGPLRQVEDAIQNRDWEPALKALEPFLVKGKPGTPGYIQAMKLAVEAQTSSE